MHLILLGLLVSSSYNIQHSSQSHFNNEKIEHELATTGHVLKLQHLTKLFNQ